MKLIPLFANSLLRLIIESSLKLATARSACTSSYLQHRETQLQFTCKRPNKKKMMAAAKSSKSWLFSTKKERF